MLAAEDSQIVADSTFYLCFLEDIKNPEALKSIIDKFDLLITPMVYKEVDCSGNFGKIKNHQKLILYPKESLGEALRPFFSEKQILKGETEVIELAYNLYIIGKPKILILDDKQARSFVLRQLPYLQESLVGTVGFVGDCYCEYNVFEKDAAKTLVILIGESPFRVSVDVIREVLAKIDSR